MNSSTEPCGHRSHLADDLASIRSRPARRRRVFILTRAFGDQPFGFTHALCTEPGASLGGTAPWRTALPTSWRSLEAGYSSTKLSRAAFVTNSTAHRSPCATRGVSTIYPWWSPSSWRKLCPTNCCRSDSEPADTLLVAGIASRYTCESSGGIPSQWNEFLPQFGHVPGQIGSIAYGVRCNTDGYGAFDYVCGVRVPSFSQLPTTLARVRIPSQKYAVFTHTGHVAAIRSTWHTIWTHWLPNSGHEVIDAPDFERYTEQFDSRTGLGGFEIWLPIKG